MTGYEILGLIAMGAVIVLLGYTAGKKLRATRHQQQTNATTPPQATGTGTEANAAQPNWWDRNWKKALGWSAAIVAILLVGSWIYSTIRAASAPTNQGRAVRVIENYASDELTLKLIAECESGGTQFEEDGVTLLYNSKEGSSAVGKYQIVESLHAEKAKALGHDLKTLEGNEAYARHLYSKEKGGPWEASRECWGAKLQALGYTSPAIYVPLTRGPFVAKVGPVGQTYEFEPGTEVRYAAMTVDDWIEINTLDGRGAFDFRPGGYNKSIPGGLERAHFRSLKDVPQEVWIEVRKRTN